MSKQLITVKNLGGRPASISQNQVLEIIRIKGEYGILTWNKAIDLSLEIHPDWVLPHYKNCLISKLWFKSPVFIRDSFDQAVEW
jgi:hypothetical protein